MFIVRCKTEYKSELDYVLSVIFDEFLKVPWRRYDADTEEIEISHSGHDAKIILPNVFFSLQDEQWLTQESYPSLPLPDWQVEKPLLSGLLSDNSVPVIYGRACSKPESYLSASEISLPVDILGSVFFMLSRYEELLSDTRDSHERFPATASLAWQSGFLERPIVDEYIDILSGAMTLLWPQIKLQPKDLKLRVTCDVDSAYETDSSVYSMVRGIGADILKRRDLSLACKNLNLKWQARKGKFSGDAHLANIDWMMSVNEEAGNKVAFYFIPGGEHPLDAMYNMDEKVIRKLLREIHQRGHEIGLHPSYNTFRHPQALQNEANTLRRVLEEENIPCEQLGGRQHYLRWDSRCTASYQEDAGMSYDSSLLFADLPGFRCGTSREFTMYDCVRRRKLKLKQRPLVLMETTIVAEQYLAKGYSSKALAQMEEIKINSLKLGGEFTFLWHNCSFPEENARSVYESLIKQ